jgi:hypothetical protein
MGTLLSVNNASSKTALTLLTLLLACPTVPAKDFGVTDYADFQIKLASRECETYVACGLYPSIDACLGSTDRASARVYALAASEFGRATFDAAAANACLASAFIDCSKPTQMRSGVFTELCTPAVLFKPVAARGAACGTDLECQAEDFCNFGQPNACPGTCKAREATGGKQTITSRCKKTDFPDMNQVCTPKADVGGACPSNPSGGTCLGASVACVDNRCTARPNYRLEGEACGGPTNLQCVISLTCNNNSQRCVRYLKAGEACSTTSGVGLCAPLLQCIQNTCRPFPKENEACGEVAGRCVTGLACNAATGGEGTCVKRPKFGETCDLNARFCEPYEQFCNNGVCANKKAIGNACTLTIECQAGTDCIQGKCNPLTCQIP